MHFASFSLHTHEGDIEMRSAFLITSLAAIAITATPLAAHVDQQRDMEIREDPIAGQYDKHWYNYLTDLLEADKELKSDLRRATDAEDTGDAWEEYENELVDADKDYVEEMRDRNFRVGRVTLGK
jgi:hypothetical protein